MLDSSMGNVLNKYLEDIVVRQDNEIKGLLAERDAAFATIGKKDEHIEGLMEHIRYLTNTIDLFANDKVKLLNELGAFKENVRGLEEICKVTANEKETAERAAEYYKRVIGNGKQFLADKESQIAAYKANYKPLNDLIDRLEEEIDDLEHEVLGLKDQREINHRRIDEKDNIIVGLRDDIIGAERYIKRLEDECLAIAIQAAESEDRADNERRGRLQLVMRL